MLVLGECGWVPFFAGFCEAEARALAQMAIFKRQYPEASFRVLGYEPVPSSSD